MIKEHELVVSSTYGYRTFEDVNVSETVKDINRNQRENRTRLCNQSQIITFPFTFYLHYEI